MMENGGKKIRLMDASDERQYMINEGYEVFEKIGPPVGAVALHYHNFYEIIYIIEGEFSSLVQDQAFTLRKGDFLLIGQNVMHKYNYVEKIHDSSRRIVLWITDDILKGLGEGKDALTACFEENGARVYHFPIYYEELLRGFLMKLAMSQILEGENETCRKVMDKGYISLFFAYLNLLGTRREYFLEGEEAKNDSLVSQVSEYIDAHIGEDIREDDIAGYVHMSKFYLLRKFKSLTGITMHGFLINKRLIRACEEIRKGAGITQAWQRAGFSDYTSFLRNFRKAYGVSPKEFWKGRF